MTSAYEDRVAVLEDKLNDLIDDFPDEPNEEDEHAFLNILKEVTGVVREAEAANYDGLQSLIEDADSVINLGVVFAHDEDSGGPFSGTQMPSFAHDEEKAPLLKDPSKEGRFSHGFLSKISPFLEDLLRITGSDKNPADVRSKANLPQPWKKTLRPHPLSTPCSRFREPLPEWTATETNQNATAVFQARCEITSGDIHSPIKMALSSTGNILALSSMGGWKNRTPYLYFYLRENQEDPGVDVTTEAGSIKVDLMSTLDEILLNEERKLIFVADYKRIKSYRWNESKSERKSNRTLRTHTMDSAGYEGPLAILPDGRFLRAGKGKVGVWDLDTLQTHGETGKDIIGSKIEADDMDTWRDDPEDIEPSTGSAISASIKLEAENADGEGLKISTWCKHPSQANVMLCGMSSREGTYYHCHSFDLEADGKIVTRYLGHGGSVEGFSTSVKADPNVFLTWCSDGHARLYDVRQPLPVLTIASARDPEPLPAAVLAHPDGIPFIFTGTSHGEDIKVWDVRSRALIYELATGNNSVEAMAWDENENALIAATMCPYVDHNGRHIDYRFAKIPKPKEAGDEAEVGEDEYYDEDEGSCWPKNAYHAEDYFGHVFDAGDHRIYKFSFKMNPDPNELPYYGSATISRGGGFW